MEYIKVICRASKTSRRNVRRDVLLDGELEGKTGNILAVETGFHIITLDGDGKPYEPSSRRPNVRDTSVNDPMEILFWQK